MKFLLSGAAGFLGSHLATKLLELNHEVVGLDDYSTGSIDNLTTIQNHKNFKIITHNVINPIHVESDFILNFACPASPKQYQFNPVKTIETNFLGMSNLLKLAMVTKSKVLQASTSEVYGDPTISPQTEDYWGNVNPIGIRSCYDEGKRSAETLCFDYLRQYNVDARVVRIFNTYGPYMSLSDGRVVSNFIVQALRDENITIFGDGNQTRSFCFVDDLISGILKVISLENNPMKPINLGNPEEITIENLAKLIIVLTNSNSKIIYENLPSDDPKRRKPDIGLAKELFAWEPSTKLEDGLKKSIAYFASIV